eukprot:1368085-Amorphochlora_amoeboformis.AAC.2
MRHHRCGCHFPLFFGPIRDIRISSAWISYYRKLHVSPASPVSHHTQTPSHPPDDPARGVPTMIHILPRSTIGNVWKIFVKTSRVSTRGLASQTAGHTNRSVLVYGGAGGLGSGIVDTFSDAGWDTVSADFRANTSAKLTVALTPGQNWGENARLVCGVLQENKLEPKVIVNAAGGWAGGSIDAEDV